MPSKRTRILVENLDDRIVPATLWVDDDRGQQPAAPYTSIQSAVDAAGANDTILVYPGTYPEQLRIGVDTNGWPLRLYGRSVDGLTLKSQTPFAATVTLPAAAPPVSAIVTVGFATGVKLDGFTIAGPGSTAGQLYDGLEVNQGASVDVRNGVFRDIGDPAGQSSGGQTGIGVYVGADGGGSAVVQNNIFFRYQTAGVVADGPNSSATVLGNYFFGSGPNPEVTQYGIQFSQNASGLAQGNFITGHQYSGPAGADPENPLSAAGVVVYQAGAVTVTGNDLVGNQTGLYIQDQSNRVVVTQNNVAGNTLDGIVLDLARGSVVVAGNAVTNNGRDGIHIQSASHDNVVAGNTVKGSGRYGIASVPTRFGDALEYEAAPSNNVIAGNAVSGSAAFDLYAESASWYQGGEGIGDIWAGNTFGTKNRPGLR